MMGAPTTSKALAYASGLTRFEAPTNEEIIALWNKIAKEAMDKVDREFQEAEQLPANFSAVRLSRAQGYAVLSFYDTVVSVALHAQRREADDAPLRRPEVVACAQLWAGYTRNFLSEDGRAAQDLARAILAALDDGSGS